MISNKQKIILIIIILIIYIIFFTPLFISNMLYNVYIYLYYLSNDGDIIKYKFNHNKFDASLINHYIKNKKLSNDKIVKIFKKENYDNSIIDNFKIKNYQILKYKRVKTYSKFVSNVSNIIFKIMKNTNYDKINI